MFIKSKIIFIGLLFACTSVFSYRIGIIDTPEYGWSLVDDNGKPFLIRGVCYSPVPIGFGIEDVNLFSEDAGFRFEDADKMQLMGANTVRIYSPGNEAEGTKKYIRQLYGLYSMYTIFPLPLEMQGADYSSSSYRNNLKERILSIVEEYKDTPGIIVWLLGNEIDYYLTDDKANWDNQDIRALTSPYKRAMARAKIVFDFADDIAKEIKKIDKNHPIGLSLGKLDYFNQLMDGAIANVDFIGLNYYQGRSFSSVWGRARAAGKPVLITEFGYDAFNTKTGVEDDKIQAEFIVSQWKDIEKNSAKAPDSNGMSLGGCIFEWTDEWWKYEGGSYEKHDAIGSWVNPSWSDFVDGKPNVQEEWFGIMGVEKVDKSFDRRSPRKAYYSIRNIWTTVATDSVPSIKSNQENKLQAFPEERGESEKMEESVPANSSESNSAGK